jgi:hypothetical protein
VLPKFGAEMSPSLEDTSHTVNVQPSLDAMVPYNTIVFMPINSTQMYYIAFVDSEY